MREATGMFGVVYRAMSESPRSFERTFLNVWMDVFVGQRMYVRILEWVNQILRLFSHIYMYYRLFSE